MYTTLRYRRTINYYNYIRIHNPSYVYVHWIFWPTTGYNDGYHVIDTYPYYVYDGYRYRYSPADQCNYQLVDRYTHSVVETFWNETCNTGYDRCSISRDRYNSSMNDNRFFCSETFRTQNYDYTRPTYEENNDDWYDGDDVDDDYYDQNYDTDLDTTNDGGNDNSCTDYDYDGNCDL